jgi:hypothetical protein
MRLWGDEPTSTEILSRPVVVDVKAQRIVRLQAIGLMAAEVRECVRNTEGPEQRVLTKLGAICYIIEGLLAEDGVKPDVPF